MNTHVVSSAMKNNEEDEVVEAYISGNEDYIIPLAFPDYLIRLEGGSAETARKYTGTDRIPYLGHAAILIINGQSGKSKYYEYGRYPPGDLGRARSRTVKNVIITASGMIDISSLKMTLRNISRQSGQSGNIIGAILRKDNVFDKAIAFGEHKIKENDNLDREPYSIYTNNCVTFVESFVRNLGLTTPSSTLKYMGAVGFSVQITDKIPSSYITQFQFYFSARDLSYYYNSNKLEIDF